MSTNAAREAYKVLFEQIWFCSLFGHFQQDTQFVICLEFYVAVTTVLSVWLSAVLHCRNGGQRLISVTAARSLLANQLLPEKLTCPHLLTNIYRILLNPKVYHRIYKSPPPVHILSRSIMSMPPHPTSWRSILILSPHLRLGLPSCLLLSGFPTKTLHAPLLATIRDTCPAHFSLLDFDLASEENEYTACFTTLLKLTWHDMDSLTLRQNCVRFC